MTIEPVLPYHGEAGDFETIDEVESALDAAIYMNNEDREIALRSIAAEFLIEHGDPERGVEHCGRLIELLAESNGLDDEDTMVWRGFLGRSLDRKSVV